MRFFGRNRPVRIDQEEHSELLALPYATVWGSVMNPFLTACAPRSRPFLLERTEGTPNLGRGVSEALSVSFHTLRMTA